MNLSLIRSMTRSAVFELENGLCFRPAHPWFHHADLSAGLQLRIQVV